MVVFCFKARPTIALDEFVSGMNRRLSGDESAVPVYSGFVHSYLKDDWAYYAVRMDPLYPPFFWIGIIINIGVWLLKGFTFTWWLLPGFVIFSSVIFWLWPLYYLIFKLVLYRKVPGCSVHFVSKSKLLRNFPQERVRIG